MRNIFEGRFLSFWNTIPTRLNCSHPMCLGFMNDASKTRIGSLFQEERVIASDDFKNSLTIFIKDNLCVIRKKLAKSIAICIKLIHGLISYQLPTILGAAPKKYGSVRRTSSSPIFIARCLIASMFFFSYGFTSLISHLRLPCTSYDSSCRHNKINMSSKKAVAHHR